MAYHKELMGSIKNYDDLVLFEPTDAKTYLDNQIRGDYRFDLIKIVTKSANKISNKDLEFFITNYFSKYLHYESPIGK